MVVVDVILQGSDLTVSWATEPGHARRKVDPGPINTPSAGLVDRLRKTAR